jgi:hypothetical protein
VYQLPLDASREYGRSYHGLGGGWVCGGRHGTSIESVCLRLEANRGNFLNRDNTEGGQNLVLF